MVNQLPIGLFKEGDIVIDVGCWDNIEPSLAMALKGVWVFAIDRYQRLKYFKEELRKAVVEGKIEESTSKKIQPMKTDVNHLPFCDESIDWVIFYYSTSWLEQFGSQMLIVYREVKRVLAEDGGVVIVEPTIARAREQQALLKTQMKSTRDGTIIIGRKVIEETLPFS